jgi:hypothetical protein
MKRAFVVALLIATLAGTIDALTTKPSEGADAPTNPMTVRTAPPVAGGLAQTITTPAVSVNAPGGVVNTPAVSVNAPGGVVNTPAVSVNGPARLEIGPVRHP